MAAPSPVAAVTDWNALKTLPTYRRIARTYWRWAPSLLLLALIVFVPLGLLDALTEHAEIGSLDFDNDFQLFAAVAGIVALTITGLLGEVFYSGAVAISLTHHEHGQAPPLREIARRLNFKRLIGVDLLFGAVIAIGLLLLVAPGVAAFVWFGLAGPLVEIENQTVRGAFARSWRLVRGRFWVVLAVLVPAELLGDGIAKLSAGLVHDVVGHGIAATWIAESASNVIFTPIYAVAAVLLTLGLIEEKDGRRPGLDSAASP